MNLFTKHPYEQGITYAEHWVFAMGIAWRMLRSVVALAVHAMLPFISIKPHLDLEATAAYLAERNRFIGTKASAGWEAHTVPQAWAAAADSSA